MSGLYDAAFDVYRALCRLEDELDATYNERRPLTQTQRNELASLKQRWTDETSRKITRVFRRARAAA